MWIRGHGGDAMRSLVVHHRIRPDLMHFYSVWRVDHGSAVGTTWPCFLGVELTSKVEFRPHFRFSMGFQECLSVFRAGKSCQIVSFEVSAYCLPLGIGSKSKAYVDAVAVP